MKLSNRREFLYHSGSALGLSIDSKLRKSAPSFFSTLINSTSADDAVALYNVDFRTAIGLGDEPAGIVDRFGQLFRSRHAAVQVELGSPLRPAEQAQYSQTLRDGYLPIVDSRLIASNATLRLCAFSSDGGNLKADYVEVQDASGPYRIRLLFPYTTALKVVGNRVSSGGRVLAEFSPPGKVTTSLAKYNLLTPETWPSTHTPWGENPPAKLAAGVEPAFAVSRNTFLNRGIEYRFPATAGCTYYVFLGALPDTSQPGEYILRLSVDDQSQRLDYGVVPPGKPVLFEFKTRPATDSIRVKCTTDPSATHSFWDCHLNAIWVFDRPVHSGDILRGNLNERALYYVQCGREPLEEIVSSVVLDYSPTSRDERRWVCLPYDASSEAFTDITATSVDSARSAATVHWDSLIDRGGELTTGVSQLDNLYKTSLINLFLLRTRYARAGREQQDIYAVKPGPDTYDNFWTRDGAYIILALEAAGFPGEAEKSLRLLWQPDLRGTLATWGQQANGSWAAPMQEWDAQGQALWALVSHYEFTRDGDWLRKVYASLRAGALWIKRATELTKFINEDGERPAYYGLLPEGEGEAIGYGYIYYHCFWAVLGIRQALRAAAALGEREDFNWMSQLDREFSGNLLASVGCAYTTVGGGKFIPATPFDPAASSWGAIAALHPTRFLAPHDPMITATLEFLETQTQEDMWPFVPGNLWTYFNSSLAMCHLLRGELPKFYAFYNSYAAHASPTNGWTEGILVKSRVGTGDMPHGWAAAAYVQMHRDALVCENEHSLELCWGVQPAWLNDGAQLCAHRAPTKFGKIDFDLQRAGTALTFDYQLTRNQHYPEPGEIRLHLPHLNEQMISVRINGRVRKLLPGETVLRLV